QRTSIGLDVHARSVVACGLDGDGVFPLNESIKF
ncbi:MAG: hypothetical protein QOI28_3945, partial [Mycobacterium sp.]|nr:hypothetical protein [Mycobacterium sp.]